MTTSYGDHSACTHPRYRCLRCGSTGCDTRDCPDQGFRAGLCRQCGHFEKVPR